jgi:glycine reductase complex component B subunit gamma
MAKEIERVGIPVAYFTAIPTVPLTVGQSRIIPGKAIPHVLGDPKLPPERERAYRRALVEQALRALTTEVSTPTLFKAEAF